MKEDVMDMEPERILVLEDDASQLATLTTMIKDEGFEVSGCSEGRQALDLLRNDEFGVAVIDLSLPDISVEDLLSELETLGDRVSMIIHTGHGSYESAKAALNLGAWAYIEKLGDPEELLLHLHRATKAQTRHHIQQEREKSLHFIEFALNAVPGNVVVLNSEGRIAVTNDGWRRFAQENGLGSQYPVKGIDYLKVCDTAKGPWSEEAPTVASGIRDMLAGRKSFLELEYPCHSPSVRRWFQLQAKPFQHDGKSWIVMSHIDVTQRVEAEERVRHESLMRKTLLDHLPCIALVLKKGTREIVACNDVATRAGAAPGKMCYEVFAERNEPCPFCMAPEAWASNEGQRLEVEYKGRHYEGIWVSLTEDLYVHYIFDISDRVEAKKALVKSERLHREAQKVAHVGHWELDPDVGTPTWSDEIFRIFGLGPGEGEPSFTEHESHLHPDDWPSLNDAVTRASRDGTPFDLIFRIIRPAGEIRWMHAIGTAIRNEEGETERLFGTAQDITELKTAEDALKQSEERFRLLYEQSPLGYQSLDKHGCLLEVNPAWLELTGYERKDAIGRWFGDIQTQESRRAFEQRFPEFIAAGRMRGAQVEVVRKDGSVIEVEVDGRVGYDRDGNFVQTHCVLRDVTKERHMQRALEESEIRHRLLFENAGPGIGYYDLNGTLLLLNKAGAQALVGDPGDFIGKSVFEIVDHQTALMIMERIGACPTEGGSIQYEDLVELPTGRRWFISSYTGIYGADNVLKGVQIVSHDITDRKKDQEKLRESQARYEGLFNNMIEGVAVYEVVGEGQDFRFRDANRSAVCINKLKREEVLGRSVQEVFPGVKEMGLFGVFQEVWKTGEPRSHPASLYKDDRLLLWVENYVFKLPSGEIVVVCADITARKQAERRILQNEHQLRSLATRLSLVEENERRRVALWLHDEVAQRLAISKLGLQTLRKSSVQEANVAKLDQLTGEVDDLIDQIRSETFELGTPALYMAGLEAAIESWLKRVLQEKHGLKTSFSVQAGSSDLPEDLKVMLFRSTRELLANVVKHSQAERVSVSLRRIKDTIEIEVSDDGLGFDWEPDSGLSDTADNPHFGLLSVHEQVEYLGGTMCIESGTERGTCITLTVPVRSQNAGNIDGSLT